MSEPVQDAEPAPVAPAEPALRAEPPAAAEARAGLLTALGLAALGVPVAGIWYALAPRVLYQVVATGRGSPVDPETKAFIADDGTFFLLTAVVGLLCGTVAYLVGRRCALGVAIGLAVGGIAGAIVAWKLGTSFGSGGFHHALRTDPTGTTVRGPLGLRAKGTLVAWPVGALLAFVLGLSYGPGAVGNGSAARGPAGPAVSG
ncbi:MAG: hypothetical protein ACJ74O_07470 [Frankiaceae bacterium]